MLKRASPTVRPIDAHAMYDYPSELGREAEAQSVSTLSRTHHIAPDTTCVDAEACRLCKLAPLCSFITYTRGVDVQDLVLTQSHTIWGCVLGPGRISGYAQSGVIDEGRMGSNRR